MYVVTVNREITEKRERTRQYLRYCKTLNCNARYVTECNFLSFVKKHFNSYVFYNDCINQCIFVIWKFLKYISSPRNNFKGHTLQLNTNLSHNLISWMAFLFLSDVYSSNGCQITQFVMKENGMYLSDRLGILLRPEKIYAAKDL